VVAKVHNHYNYFGFLLFEFHSSHYYCNHSQLGSWKNFLLAMVRKCNYCCRAKGIATSLLYKRQHGILLLLHSNKCNTFLLCQLKMVLFASFLKVLLVPILQNHRRLIFVQYHMSQHFQCKSLTKR
jgi:hypothetical protein